MPLLLGPIFPYGSRPPGRRAGVDVRWEAGRGPGCPLGDAPYMGMLARPLPRPTSGRDAGDA